MGNIMSSFNNTTNNINNAINNINYEEIPSDEFLCPRCDRVPEILNITNKGEIKFKCKRHGINIKPLKEYLESIIIICSICKKSHNEEEQEEFRYCYDCEKYFCRQCYNIEHSNTKHTYIVETEKKDKSNKYSKKYFTYFCENCQENFTREELGTNHKDHNKIKISSLENEYNESENMIREKNEKLLNIIKFNKFILNTSRNFKNNYFHLKSVINLGKLIKKTNERKLEDVECALYELDQKIANSKKPIEELEKSKISIKRKETSLHLQNREIDLKIFKLITEIKFYQLKEINLSGNNLKDITPLYKMSLPFLEYLNMSHNNIEEIGPIAKLNSKKLKEIFLHYNKIKNLEAFLDSNFRKLEILRVEENENIQNSKDFEEIKKKYNINYQLKTFEDIKRDCKIEIETNEKEIIDLNDQKGGDKLLKNLYIFLTNESKKELPKLKLANNGIENPSYLERINFVGLILLDLSMNNIKNLDFLLQMRIKYLKILYLNDNKIFDIFPLTQIKSPLSTLSLKNNNFNPNAPEILEIIRELKKKYDKIQIDLEQ